MERFVYLKKCTTKVLLFIVGVMLFSSCTFTRVIKYNFSSIDDHKLFPYRSLKAGPDPYRFPEKKEPSMLPATISYGGHKNVPWEEFWKKSNTIALLIIKNDTIVTEEYFQGYSDHTLATTFSVTKSFTSALAGCAIDDGYIQSVEQPVTDYIPELKRNGFDKVKIKHLLQMTSGINYSDSEVNPFSKHANFSHTKNLRKQLLRLKLRKEPGEPFTYRSGNTQLLGLVLERALKDQTITEYMQQRIWMPLGMEFDASWSLDHEENGLEKTFSGLNTTARDLAKFGTLYMNRGKWKEHQIISKDWIIHSTKTDTTCGSVPYYQYQWWIMSDQYGDFRAEGHLGQFVYVNPSKQFVMVRLGKSRGGISWKNWKAVLTYLAEEVR